MFLVYEVNNLTSGDVNAVEESEMKLFHTKESAISEFERRKDAYETDGTYTFLPEFSDENIASYAEWVSEDHEMFEGGFEIRIAELQPAD